MNFLKKFLGSSPKGELAIIPSGQLYLRRVPGSPKSDSECLYTDAVASVRETSSPHNYLLVVQRAYQEGEEQLKEDEDDEDDFNESKDEKLSLIDKSIHIHKFNRSGSWTVSWINTEGDEGERFEFVVDEDVKSSEVDHFMKTIYACCYERKFQKSSAGAIPAQLEEFVYDPEEDELEGLTTGISSLTTPSPDYEENEQDDDDDSIFQDATDFNSKPNTEEPRHLLIETPVSKSIVDHNISTEVKGDILSTVKAELRLYDPAKEVFVLQEKEAIIQIIDLGKWEYWLSIKSSELELGTVITSALDPYFDDSVTSFIFVYQVETAAFSLLLKLPDSSSYTVFKESFSRATWETSNRSKWEKADAFEKKYIIEAFNANEKDEEMEDFSDDEESEEENDDDEYDNRAQFTNPSTWLHKELLSDSEDKEGEDNQTRQNYFKGSRNKNLTIAYKNNRSYVTRDDRIGVFKTTDDDELEFTAAIENLSIDGKKKFNPKKMMLHTEDRSLVMQGDKKDTLYRMDLEKGKIVDEWKIKNDLPVVEFGPTKKFNQMTGEQTFLGISDKGLFKVDPRLSGDKLVESEYKSYVTKNDFSSFGTTENGYIAVASNKGDIRLYDKLGIRAKSLIPAIGDAIVHVEISADGKWLLATCKTYLILIDLTIKNGNNAGSLGFLKSFGKDSAPKARTLRISAEHVAHIKTLTGESLNFTKAHFNTGINTKEQSIISSSGPYAVTWSLKKILRGDAEPYLIKRYSSNVVADNFKFGTDKNVIIALADDVGMINKREFRKADRNSLAFTPRKF